MKKPQLRDDWNAGIHACKIAERSHQVSEEDFAVLRNHGLSDEDIWDIGSITALFALSNRVANMLALQPNAEFYTMGRVPGE